MRVLPNWALICCAVAVSLARLEQRAPRQHRVVMLCYFAGLEHTEVAEVLGVAGLGEPSGETVGGGDEGVGAGGGGREKNAW